MQGSSRAGVTPVRRDPVTAPAPVTTRTGIRGTTVRWSSFRPRCPWLGCGGGAAAGDCVGEVGVLLSQLAFEQLAAGVLRERVDERERLGHFDRREPCPSVRLELLGGELDA